MLKQFIEVSLQREGIHCWPDATKHPGVEFLANPHRHIFHIYVKMQVWSNDREVEFILFKRELESTYNKGINELNHMSCEMIAEQLIEYIQQHYGANRELVVRVYEDNENGAVIEYQPNWENAKSNIFSPVTVSVSSEEGLKERHIPAR